MATLKNGAAGSLGLAPRDVLDLVRTLRAGLPYARLQAFARKTGLPMARIAAVLGIPPRTLARRKLHGTLSGPESERLARLARLFDSAVNLFEGDRGAALIWLETPAKALANRTPLQLAESEIGARAVEDLIGRLEFGVYS